MMSWVTRTLTSSVGGKIIVALSGVIAIGFVCGHLVGNMTVYAGPDAINAYAAGLHKIPALLWGFRTIIVASFAIHILCTLWLNWQSYLARPIAYKKKSTIQATLASLTMVYTGIILGVFIVFHLGHFTWRIGPFADFNSMLITTGDLAGKLDVYKMVVMGFSVPWVSALYVACMILLGFHLSHAVSSFFQTLGLKHDKYNPLIELLGPVVGTVLAVGNISIPLAVLTGILKVN